MFAVWGIGLADGPLLGYQAGFICQRDGDVLSRTCTLDVLVLF